MPGNGDRVCLGVIVRAQGVRGAVRIKPFTAEPDAVGAYGPVTDAAGTRTFTVKVTGVAKGMATARIEGVADRDAAEALRGTELWVSRDALPAPEEDEYYHHDLIGLRAWRMEGDGGLTGESLGEVVAVENFGAGDVIELRLPDGKPVLVPFTREAVPVVDIANGRIGIDPPPGLMPGEDEDADGREGGPSGDGDEGEDGKDGDGRRG